jgi:formylglycine-generating enzyme required for sulfatase activity
LPNDAGLFDMHGNLTEWNHDARMPDGTASSHRRRMCSGNFLSEPIMVESSAGLITQPLAAGITAGFRVARTHR